MPPGYPSASVFSDEAAASGGARLHKPNWVLNGGQKKDQRHAENRRTPSFQSDFDLADGPTGRIVVSEDGTLRAEPNYLATRNPISLLTLKQETHRGEEDGRSDSHG
ncbi:hypothetical protein NDU88_001401 [Pleurodeles waltl]|uniref:Uncharacterized protein n=1 Tax=Pleurodeles waltl TaxID=8319 RepID=A0AAV7Q468_PLEWA|nr:hypothetical protein NDU88_001401 [Pleurodeles waltl]